MKRNLRYSTVTNDNLLNYNNRHKFAQTQALRLYQCNGIYSFIPKNACSTIRLSIAMYNGCINDLSDFKWIHANNCTFQADLAALCSANYTFTILRCPYTRLASVYLDKIVGTYHFVRKIYKNKPRTILHKLKEIVDPNEVKREAKSMSFYNFVYALKQNNAIVSDPHWRYQVDFLVYKDYDDYFCVEEFPKAIRVLKSKIELDIVDAREFTSHGTENLKKINHKNFSKTPALTIRQMKKEGECPSHLSLYNDEIVELVRTMYSEDIKMHKNIFGTKNLMFS